MKTIDYQSKQTSASTQYNQISQQDMTSVLSELIRYMALSSELRRSTDTDHKTFVKDYWTATDKELPRSKTGMNSPESFCAGVINNIMCGNQNDLSDKQMDAITRISDQFSQIMPVLGHIEKRLQPACKPFEKIIFRENLFS